MYLSVGRTHVLYMQRHFLLLKTTDVNDSDMDFSIFVFVFFFFFTNSDMLQQINLLYIFVRKYIQLRFRYHKNHI